MRVGRSGVVPAKVMPALGALGEQHSCLTRWNGLGMIQDRVPRTPHRLPRAATLVPLLSQHWQQLAQGQREGWGRSLQSAGGRLLPGVCFTRRCHNPLTVCLKALSLYI